MLTDQEYDNLWYAACDAQDAMYQAEDAYRDCYEACGIPINKNTYRGYDLPVTEDIPI